MQFIGINSNRQENVKEISEYSERHKFEFTVLKDPENNIADYFGARRTPEVFLLDAKRVLRYIGAIDNSPKAPTEHYLRNALDLVITGENISKESKKTRAVLLLRFVVRLSACEKPGWIERRKIRIRNLVLY